VFSGLCEGCLDRPTELVYYTEEFQIIMTGRYVRSREGATMSEPDRNTDNGLSYEVYLEERKLLVDAEREGARSFDKAILTLAAGAFGLSLTFVKEVAPCAESGTVAILVSAWGFFCASLLSTLISFLTSQTACSRQVTILEAKYRNDRSGQEEICLKNRPAIWTSRLNMLSIITFVVGTILLAAFGAVSLLQ
jgi:hypothetical protein